ncbi:hypothetical protein A3D88_00490 [Candidatus Peribacteria bacterium RIFCSPHIGHO2_02_FULL_52_16]|nr:MAG: hypothetical protein A2706_01435 [Candidatus Peribacteria bacterium RIFCSPHIGHO2_01_FULL_51_35]OGJ61952.1 MAG: hypothetical protein A3D88_00490 [Candidatus Peribacteria bacterium RIFCSPHIGHO2_02_FULL_52_16]
MPESFAHLLTLFLTDACLQARERDAARLDQKSRSSHPPEEWVFVQRLAYELDDFGQLLHLQLDRSNQEFHDRGTAFLERCRDIFGALARNAPAEFQEKLYHYQLSASQRLGKVLALQEELRIRTGIFHQSLGALKEALPEVFEEKDEGLDL